MKNEKKCTRCKVLLPLDDFVRNKSSPDGRYSLCKPCRRSVQIEYRKNNKDKVQKWVENNRDRIRLAAKRSYEKNKEKNKEKIRQKSKKQREKNLEDYRRRSREYSQTAKGIHKIYKYAAKKRNYEFLLTVSFFESNWQSNCHYCNEKLETIGFDRVSNDIGYIESNVVPCCEICNKMKMVLSKDIFIKKCRQIASNANLPLPNEIAGYERN